MRLVIISDTHGLHDKMKSLPDGDVLIHCGDFTNTGTVTQITAFAEWFKSQPHANKIVIAGNHDFGAQHFLQEGKEDMLKAIFAPAIYLRDSWVHLTINGEMKLFYGSPWQPEFFDWAFNLPRGQALKERWDLIPSKVDVLITHGPPEGVLDRVGHQHVGCGELRKQLADRLKPQVHCFGHIHCAAGTWKQIDSPTTFVNAAVCTEGYKPSNDPVVIDI